ncbi:MAG: ParA family protein [PVC group bacterium]|nr:ParA family protein [PVC group bacterium]
MGKIIGICNQKGGVGKTTSAINLSTYVAAKGYKTLLVDSDPQANATSGLGLDKKAQTKNVYDLLMGLASVEEVKVQGPLENLFILPSNVALTGAEIELVDTEQREFKMKQVLSAARDQFDFIFIDCPPSIGLLTLNCLVAADKVLIPLQCEYYSLEGISQLMETIALVKSGLNRQLETAGIVLTMADFRTKLTSDVISEVRGFFKEKVFETVIPRSIRISEAPGFGKPLLLYDETSLGAQKYESLAEEFLKREVGEAGSVAKIPHEIVLIESPEDEIQLAEESNVLQANDLEEEKTFNNTTVDQ